MNTPQRHTVLLVDDNRPMTLGLTRLFQRAGYDCVAFDTGLAALEYAGNANENRSSGQPGAESGAPTRRGVKAAVAIVDIHLPDISGLILTQRLRESLGPAVPIIVLSGDGSMEVLNSLSHVGATHFFRKPVGAQQLLDHVKALLE